MTRIILILNKYGLSLLLQILCLCRAKNDMREERYDRVVADCTHEIEAQGEHAEQAR